MNTVEELLLDRILEHELERMERRKQQIEDEAYLLAKCIGIDLVRSNCKPYNPDIGKTVRVYLPYIREGVVTLRAKLQPHRSRS